MHVGGRQKAPWAGSRELAESGIPEGLSMIGEGFYLAVWPWSRNRKQKPDSIHAMRMASH